MCMGGTCYGKLVTTSYVTPLITTCGTWPLAKDILRAIQIGEMRINEQARFNIDAQLGDYMHLTAVDDGKYTAMEILEQFPLKRIGGILNSIQKLLLIFWILLSFIGQVVADESDSVIVTMNGPGLTITENEPTTVTVAKITTVISVTTVVVPTYLTTTVKDSSTTLVPQEKLLPRGEEDIREQHLLKNVEDPVYLAAKYTRQREQKDDEKDNEDNEEKLLLAVDILGVKLSVPRVFGFLKSKRDCKNRCSEKNILLQNKMTKEQWDTLSKKKRCCDSVYYVPEDDDSDDESWFGAAETDENDISVLEGMKRMVGAAENGKFRGRDVNVDDVGYRYLRFFDPGDIYRVARKLGANPLCGDIIEFRDQNGFTTKKVKFFVKAWIYKYHLLYRENFPEIGIDEVCLRYGDKRVG